MRVLRGVVYILKMIEPRTEPRSTPKERGLGGDAKPEARIEKEEEDEEEE